MTRNEAIEAVADYYRLDYPDMDENGNYIISDDYDWESGCYSGSRWMSLKNFIRAIEHLFDDDDE